MTPTTAPFPAPSPVYLGPPKFHGDAVNKPIRRIVLHSTVSPCVPGGARATAAYFRDGVVRPSSAHYCVDPGEVVQVTFDSVVAYHDGENVHELGIEMCDMPAIGRGALLRWTDKNHRAMLRLTIDLVARLCLANGIPATFLEAAHLNELARGITTHANESAAFHESTHWDPGDWPRQSFMRRVRRRMRRLEKAHRAGKLAA